MIQCDITYKISDKFDRQVFDDKTNKFDRLVFDDKTNKFDRLVFDDKTNADSVVMATVVIMWIIWLRSLWKC